MRPGSASIGFALVLAAACTKSGPVELRARELPDCGPIVALTEVDGRMVGVSDRPTHLATPKASACAFDLDTQLDQLHVDSLTWDGHPIVGGNTQLVDDNGVQTIVGSWFTNEGGTLNVGLLRRTPAGLEQLASVQQNESMIPMGKLDAVQIGGRVLVGFTRAVHNPSCGESIGTPDSHRIWRVGDELGWSINPGTAERITIVGDDLVVAGITEADEILVKRVPAKPDHIVTEARWVAQLRPRDGEARPNHVLDVEVVGGSVYVLSQGKDRVWLSRVSADAGTVAWSLIGDGFVGELSPIRAGVRVTTFGRQQSEHELRRFEVDEAGNVGPTRVTAVAGMGSSVVLTTLATGEDERVWLGGYLDSGGEDLSPGWVGMVVVE